MMWKQIGMGEWVNDADPPKFLRSLDHAQNKPLTGTEASHATLHEEVRARQPKCGQSKSQ